MDACFESSCLLEFGRLEEQNELGKRQQQNFLPGMNPPNTMAGRHNSTQMKIKSEGQEQMRVGVGETRALRDKLGAATASSRKTFPACAVAWERRLTMSNE